MQSSAGSSSHIEVAAPRSRHIISEAAVAAVVVVTSTSDTDLVIPLSEGDTAAQGGARVGCRG